MAFHTEANSQKKYKNLTCFPRINLLYSMRNIPGPISEFASVT